MSNTEAKIQAEFSKAAEARQAQNEGQARVCARRAAGIAVREYLLRRGMSPRGASAYDLLILIQDDPLFPSDLKPIADHLTARVDTEFKLPVDVDLVEEARQFCDALLNRKP